MSGHLYWIQECSTCKHHFREINNLGNWKCRKHTGSLRLHYFLDVSDAVEIWDCCNTSPTPYVYCTFDGRRRTNPLFSTVACTRCDHFAAADGPSTSSIKEKEWDNHWVLTFKKELNENKVRPGLQASNLSSCSELEIYRICQETDVTKKALGRNLFPRLAAKRAAKYCYDLNLWATYY